MKKRILTIILAAVLVITCVPMNAFGASAVSKSPFIKGNYYHNERFEGRSLHHGIDVSEWQKSTIDWNKVKKDGVEFAIIRVGYRGLTEGTLNEDKYFRKNIEGAVKAGIKVGVYIYSQAITKEEAVAEADFILERIKGYKIELPVVFDIEYPSGSRANKVLAHKTKKARTNGTDICIAFMDRIKEAGYTPMVYTYLNLINNYLYAERFLAGGYDIWIAQYNNRCDLNYEYKCWQYTSSGSVDGISGRVDCNFWYDDGTYFNTSDSTILPEPDEPEVKPEPDEPAVPEEPQEPVIEKTDGLALKTRTTSSVTISWDKVADALKYNIYRSDSYGGTYKLLASTTKTSYKDSSLTQGREYYYRVEAVNGDIKGAKSNKFAAAVKPKYDRYGKTTETNINLRTQADTDYKVLTMVGKNEDVTVLASSRDKAGNVWYKVRYQTDDKEITGYMISDYLKITKKGTTTDKLNMRKGAGVKYSSITVIPEGKRLTIYSVKKVSNVSWYRVKYKVKGKYKTGWVCGTYVKALNLE